jgi:hypothetical protein
MRVRVRRGLSLDADARIAQDAREVNRQRSFVRDVQRIP